MTDVKIEGDESYPDNYHDAYSKTTFGFWLYLVTDFVLFGSLFAVYIVLQKKTFGGPSASDLFHLPFNLFQSVILLVCSFTSGIAGGYAHRREKSKTIIFFMITFLLGLCFLSTEFMEFARVIKNGNDWKQSAFLSSYFTLIGTHAVHVIFALLWTLVLILPTLRFGITLTGLRRLTCLRMFWQFINIVWVFIFTIVYLMRGV